MNTTDGLSRSMEDYLEAIAVLRDRDGHATVTALSEIIGVKKPSVDWALKKLSAAGLVVHERYGDVGLTDNGVRIADDVRRRHRALLKFLTDVLGVDPATAESDACRMEHSLSRDSIDRLERYMSFIGKCYPGRSDWIDIFNRYVEDGRDERVLGSDLDGWRGNGIAGDRTASTEVFGGDDE